MDPETIRFLVLLGCCAVAILGLDMKRAAAIRQEAERIAVLEESVKNIREKLSRGDTVFDKLDKGIDELGREIARLQGANNGRRSSGRPGR